MALGGLLSLLHRSRWWRELGEAVEKEASRDISVPDSGKAYLLAAVAASFRRPALIVTHSPESSRRLYEELLLWCGEGGTILHFPETEALPFERLTVDEATVHGRLRVLSILLEEKAGARTGDAPPVIVASAHALAQKTLSLEVAAAAFHRLREGERVDVSALLLRWQRLGYRVEPAVEAVGTMARRGGILDIFSPSMDLPARIELLGNDIESMRLFDPLTQRSQEKVREIAVVPASEILTGFAEKSEILKLLNALDFTRCSTSTADRIRHDLATLASEGLPEDLYFYAGLFNNGCLLDYLPKEAVLVLDEPSLVEEACREVDLRAEELRRQKEERGDLPANFPSHLFRWEELAPYLESRWALRLFRWAMEGRSEITVLEPAQYRGRLDSLGSDMRRMVEERRRTVLVTLNQKRLAEVLTGKGVTAIVGEDLREEPPPGSIIILPGILPEGFVMPLEDGTLVLLTDKELFGTAKQRRTTARFSRSYNAFLADLSPGSYVVHIDHGVARFVGTGKVSSELGEKEYLILEYAEGDKLYVPLDQLDRVGPYMAPGDHAPSLTRLGTQEWARVKERVKRSAQEMARELLELYSTRELVQGHAFQADTPWQAELEEAFPYVETPDQQSAIEEVKQDMESPRPMDRLVCGDVGYGKTEVAIRAAFKALMDGKQVAVLVPTTILAQQHYATFTERMAPFPAHVEVLSRFRTAREQEAVLQGLKEGKVDVVVGTHRLLQKDVAFRDLGLVIVDEEQRFGVAHKEKLKQARREVDVLTLSATPIPRTLNMALTGIRDMSTMETPPEARLSVKTYVSEYSEDLIREAIIRELDRDGQVFFLHNRVETIYAVAERLKALAPEARIGVAHGRMQEELLERTMAQFTGGEVDVLVCTTIIEAGLDIPNVNTLIINRADRFGLAQLYQLRGRVGRGVHRAYAYLLIPKGGRITETAQRRLKAILAASELGAGFRIAMKDLEIRGAGNLLGPEQSGQIQAVGFELYCRLLREAVEEARAQGVVKEKGPPQEEPQTEVKVDIPIPAYIPEAYVPDLPTRLGMYRRFARIGSREEAGGLAEELKDRFGPLPVPVQDLLYVVELKALAGSAGVVSISKDGGELVLQMREEIGGAHLALQRALGPQARVGNTQVRLDVRDKWQKRLVQVLERIDQFRARLRELVGA
ncbi:MAG: transcription-repair coupling factor [Chloroflexi bacterium]|nr:transcription-repair coupling factor [Chloroflexota bacterium]